MLSLSFLTLSLPFTVEGFTGAGGMSMERGGNFPRAARAGISEDDATPHDSKLNYNNDEKLRRRAHPSVVTSSAASASQAAAGGRAGGRRRQACRHSFRPRNEAAAAAKGRTDGGRTQPPPLSCCGNREGRDKVTANGANPPSLLLLHRPQFKASLPPSLSLSIQ